MTAYYRPEFTRGTLSVGSDTTRATFLYETSSIDPVIYVSVTVLLLTITSIACLIPARRAARFDPMTALRGQE